MDSTVCAAHSRAACVATERVVVEMALEWFGARAGAGRDCASCRCCLLDLLLEACQCAGAAWDCLTSGLQTGAAAGAGPCPRGAKMKAVKIIAALVVVAALCAPAYAESRRIMGGSAGGNKYQFFYETFLDPAIPELGRLGGGTIGGEGTIHRFMSDRRQHVYFGYDVTIEELPQPNTYRLAFSQLTADSVRDVLGDDASMWTQLPAPNWGGPAVRTVRAGEVLALDLLTNSATGQRIVDYVSVKG